MFELELSCFSKSIKIIFQSMDVSNGDVHTAKNIPFVFFVTLD
jgi:hypothetical protein